MPIYEYQCTQCGEKFEVRHAIGEAGSSLSCPKCHAPNPKRLFSSFFSSHEPEYSYPPRTFGETELNHSKRIEEMNEITKEREERRM